MLIALQCRDRKVVQEVDNYYHLRAQCVATFLPYVRNGNDVDLCYSIPKGYLERSASPGREQAGRYVASSPNDADEECVTAYVRCPASFDTFIHVWEVCLRELQLQQQEHVIPTLYVVQGAPVDVPDSFQAKLVSPPRNKAAPPPADHNQGYQTRRKAAPLSPLDMEPQSPVKERVRTPSAAAPNGAFSVEAHANTPNAVKARALLDSFAPQPKGVVPVIRAIMRCGEASVLVPFNARRPPIHQQLLESVKEAMLAKLRATEAELVANSPSRQRGVSSTDRDVQRLEEASLAALNIANPSEVIFVLSMFLPKSAAEGCDAIDVDDDADVALLAEATLEAGNDYATYLIVESHERSDPTLLSLPNSFFFGELVPHAAPLTFNRASSPVRHHVILDVEDD